MTSSTLEPLDRLDRHLGLSDLNGVWHVVPRKCFEQVADGTKSVEELSELRELIPGIIAEWLASMDKRS